MACQWPSPRAEAAPRVRATVLLLLALAAVLPRCRAQNGSPEDQRKALSAVLKAKDAFKPRVIVDCGVRERRPRPPRHRPKDGL